MAEQRDFLVEIGTEELPPKDLKRLSAAFEQSLVSEIARTGLDHGPVHSFATPRRLAVRIDALATRQPARKLELRGPPLKIAFDADGNPTRAAEAFASKCGVDVGALGTTSGAKGEWLSYEGEEPGLACTELMPDLVARSLAQLPVARRMRWGSGDAEFVRPVHWLVMLLGTDVVETTQFGVASGRTTFGHRFHAPGAITLSEAADYPAALADKGYVVPGFADRRDRIEAQATAAARAAGGSAHLEPALLDEVTALVEWPVALVGNFDADFLQLPREVLIATLQNHQRYFPVLAQDGRLQPAFVTISNLESSEPGRVRAGNERVIRPRLADARFFWDNDRKKRLADRVEALKGIVFEAKLGTIHDKSQRVAVLAAEVANANEADAEHVARAALLAKCDLVTAMVGEFPELQGVMGRYYAAHDGEPEEVGAALEEHYLPRFAGDRLPTGGVGQAIAVADKLDTLCGIFAIGKRPTGTRDPFGLRRAAVGLLRILIEDQLDLPLRDLIEVAVHLQPVNKVGDSLAEDVYGYTMERLRAYYSDSGTLESHPEIFDAVLLRKPASPLDFDRRLAAVMNFMTLEQAQTLAAANKRVANILRKAEDEAIPAQPNPALFQDAEEKQLYEELVAAESIVEPLLKSRNYTDALSHLARLRAPVDAFFDAVMVMTEDPAVRRNRLALLARMRESFLRVADLSAINV